MNIFDKRPLALILTIILSGFVAFSTKEVWLRVITICAIPLLVFLFFYIKPRKFIFLVLSVSLLISALCSGFYFDYLNSASTRFKNKVEIEGCVTNIQISNYQGKITLKTNSLNGELLRSYKLLIYASKSEAGEIKIGNTVKLEAEISAFDETDSNYFKALGYNGVIYQLPEYEVVKEDTFHVDILTAELREKLTRRVAIGSDSFSGNLVSALLLGERDRLPNSVVQDFARLGLTHVLALSGTNLAMLSVALRKLLSVFGIGRRVANFVTIPFSFLYMALTGFPVSVVRAGIMVIILSALYLLVGCYDTLTSLLIAVSVIIFVSPYAVYDVSLWLSAFATLGIAVYNEYTSKPPTVNKAAAKPISRRLVEFCLLGLLSSVFAVISTLIFCVFSFDDISIVSPIATLLISPILELIMYGGAFLMIFGRIPILSEIVIGLCTVVNFLTSSSSSINGLYVSTDYISIKIIGFATAMLLFCFFVIKTKHKKAWVALSSVLLVVFFLLSASLTANRTSTQDIVYYGDDGYSAFIMTDNGVTGMIVSASTDNYLPYRIIADMQSEKITELDYFLFTNYSYNLPGCYELLTKYTRIDTLVIPEPRNYDERGLQISLKKLADHSGTNFKTFESDIPVMIGSYGLTLKHSTICGTGTARSAYTIDVGEKRYVFLSSGMMLADTDGFAKELINESYGIIFGGFGKKYPTPLSIDAQIETTKKLILASSNLYLTQDAMRFYKNNGCEVISHPLKESLFSSR